ncbi:peptidase S26 [Gluconacetobacter liquefaciens]|uniref:Conjugative transfer signal peptidase TraF n=1 Tax=Gluconacetobacter liquefaciens TaxID=89584 RepID=A0A370G5Z2_GLULI|nr:S26 family signal peptidase [Gluconacetobacter liquefaciens]MBB2185438.1 S26 family signal peptidase [Gluconacetobacter liquefaciens]RDI39241.1 conjugative transfer signal peptidase TraF [Gluconacetobacter liquefaciens]GBQ93952.1 conjugal transfer protein precursor [Gluconacetobacter liquefaciens NRIC 0522]GEB38012.1 peptidase S26 [Gluconacetobacter liquefaciens]
MTRFGWFFTTYVAVMAIMLGAFFRPAPRLIWNATASTPVGLYRLQSVRILHVGDLVAIRPPADIAGMLARGGYLPLGVPLLKPVAALPGQRVCRIGAAITVDGKALGAALAHDHRGRSLPVWQGCRHVLPGQIFVMNPAIPTSLDGRYFGVLSVAAVLGRAQPLWLVPSPISSSPKQK